MAKKNKINYFFKLFFSNYFLILILVLFFFLSGIFIKKYDENKNSNSDLNKFKQKIENLEKGNNDLENLIKYLNSDFFVEKEAREKLDFKKEGENVIVVKSTNIRENNKNSLIIDKEKSINKFLPLRWFDYFFSKS